MDVDLNLIKEQVTHQMNLIKLHQTAYETLRKASNAKSSARSVLEPDSY